MSPVGVPVIAQREFRSNVVVVFTGKVYAPDQSNPDIQGIALAAGVLPPGGTVEGAVSYTVGFYDDVFTVRWSHSPFIVPSS